MPSYQRINELQQDTQLDAAIGRIVDSVEADTEVFYYSLRLPKAISDDPKQASGVFKKIQSDLSKNVKRSNGGVCPRYVAITNAADNGNANFSVAMFVEKQEQGGITGEFIESKGNYIMTSKLAAAAPQCSMETWLREDLGIKVKAGGGQHIGDTTDKEAFAKQLHEALGERIGHGRYGRSLFISRLPAEDRKG